MRFVKNGLKFYCLFLFFISISGIGFANKEKELLAEGQKLSYEGQLKHAEDLLGKRNPIDKESDENNDSTNTLILSMIWGSIGVGFFIYGKKQARAVFLLCGILLCIVPYFISSALVSLILGSILFFLPFKIKI
jgi:hypothetical protein